jgi:hypothetical protein
VSGTILAAVLITPTERFADRVETLGRAMESRFYLLLADAVCELASPVVKGPAVFASVSFEYNAA